MNLPRRSIALAAVLWLGAVAVHAESVSEARYGPCLAEQVGDGRTASLRCGEQVVRVRLAGVTTPAPGETGYEEAGRGLRALLRGRELFIAPEIPGRATPDPDGLTLVHLYDRVGQSINVALVSLGWASYAVTDAYDPLAKRFEIAERDARAEQRAMWSVWAYTVGRGEPRAASER